MTARPIGLALALSLALGCGPAAAQSVTSAFTGFSGRSDQPVQIEADKLEVREKDQAAVFSGNVHVAQGTSTLRARRLTILYDSSSAPDKGPELKTPAGAGTPTGRNIRRLEADGGISVSTGDQKATGEKGVFDMQNNRVTVTGNVVVVQGQNVLKGDRLTVDLTTQQSRLESTGGSGRVQGVFTPSQGRPTP